MKLKITGRALPKHQQKLQVSGSGSFSFPSIFPTGPSFTGKYNPEDPFGLKPKEPWANLYKPMGLRDGNSNVIQSTLPGAQQKPDWMFSDTQMEDLKKKSSWAFAEQPAPKQPKLTGYEKASLIVGGMGIANNLLAQNEYRKQQEKVERYNYTDSAYGSYTPSFSRGYQETNRKNPATNYSFPQFAGQTLAPTYGFAQEGGVLVPEVPMGAYEMPVFNQMILPGFSGIPTAESAPVSAVPASSASVKSSGANPLAEQTWADISSQFEGVTNLGIWGDARHKKSVSDHNTGDALDIGISEPNQGNSIAQKLIQEAKDRNVKYIIWNKQIWNPSISNEWRPYSGSNPHTTHVHVSFNRSFNAPENIDKNAGEISFTHNNPLNIHFGDFASTYGGAKGSPDGTGNVAIFKDLQTGLKANTDLLFGPAYNNLPISKARNKWVSGDPNIPNPSTSDIVKAMGKDVVIAQLTPQEKDKLFKLFAKWEGKQAYNLIKDRPIFEEGGEYELSDDEINDILKHGGQIQYL